MISALLVVVVVEDKKDVVVSSFIIRCYCNCGECVREEYARATVQFLSSSDVARSHSDIQYNVEVCCPAIT
ncbi:1646_t:CDS:2 [Paraglomus occultum]|uniref:1646_t:CDS:1 n=1 Tax=Paraglomus occultum TaxID=144539 RepID=A0A9N8WEJ3_9GLOM|nr:1646_t:CDS:2 [Paraglomus occultum]